MSHYIFPNHPAIWDLAAVVLAVPAAAALDCQCYGLATADDIEAGFGAAMEDLAAMDISERFWVGAAAGDDRPPMQHSRASLDDVCRWLLKQRAGDFWEGCCSEPGHGCQRYITPAALAADLVERWLGPCPQTTPAAPGFILAAIDGAAGVAVEGAAGAPVGGVELTAA